MKKILLALIIFSCIPVLGQNNGSYVDVAVIINDNSDVSKEIGLYFQQQRNIPDKNIIHISSVVDEEIDSLTFDNIRIQVRNHLLSNNLTNDINYIVTTKGVPLRVKRGKCEDGNISTWKSCASVDSELSLVLSQLEEYIGKPDGVKNPYLNSNSLFSRADYDIYLVSRLDGYTVLDIKNLIDRSSYESPVSKEASKFVLDLSYIDNSPSFDIIDNKFQNLQNYIGSNGWNCIYHPEYSLLTNQTEVIAYSSINFDPGNKVLNNSWLKGSVAEILFSFSARTFNRQDNPDNELLLADLINEGVCGAIGYPYHAFVHSTFNTNLFFKNYFFSETRFNLAESYYSAIPGLSWQTILVGDPKTSVSIDKSTGFNEDQGQINISPNPSNGIFTIKPNCVGLTSIDIYNLKGLLIKSINIVNNSNLLTIDISEQQPGLYILFVKTDCGNSTHKVFKSK